MEFYLFQNVKPPAYMQSPLSKTFSLRLWSKTAFAPERVPTCTDQVLTCTWLSAPYRVLTFVWQSADLHLTMCWLAPDSEHLHPIECWLAYDRVLTCTWQSAHLHPMGCCLSPDRVLTCNWESAHLRLTECSLAPDRVLTCTWQSADLHPKECAPAP